MSEKRFFVETVAVRDKVITDKEKCYSYEDLDEIVDLLNEQQATIEQQEQSITILKQEIADTQAILEILSEKLKGWNNE